MSWGTDGEELREQAKVELALVRLPTYRLKQVADRLRHPEKGPLLRALVDEAYAVFDRIEALLRR